MGSRRVVVTGRPASSSPPTVSTRRPRRGATLTLVALVALSACTSDTESTPTTADTVAVSSTASIPDVTSGSVSATDGAPEATAEETDSTTGSAAVDPTATEATASPSPPDATAIALAALGITVADDTGQPVAPITAPAVPILLHVDTASALGRAAAAGMGFLGSDLDALGEPVDGLGTVSEMLARFVLEGVGPGAAWARTLMPGAADGAPAGLVFPVLVLEAFHADLLHLLSDSPGEDGSTTGTTDQPAGFASSAARHQRPDGNAITDCSSAEFAAKQDGDAIVLQTVNAYVSKVPGATAVPGVGIIVGPGEVLEYREIVQRVVQLELLAHVASLFTVWTPEIKAEPEATRKAIGDEAGLAGTVTVHVEGELTAAQRSLLDCVESHGGITSTADFAAENHKVVWSVEQAPGGLAITDSLLVMTDDISSTKSPTFSQDFKDTHLDKTGSATMKYHTGTEPKISGEERTGNLMVRASFPRPEWNSVLNKLYGTWLAELAPHIAATTEEQIAASADLAGRLQAATDKIATLLEVAQASISVPVTYHLAPTTWSLVTYPPGFDASNSAPTMVAYTCTGLNSIWNALVWALSPELERVVQIDFSAGDDTTLHLSYELPPAGTSTALDLQYDVNLHLDQTADPPTVRISAIQTELDENGNGGTFPTQTWGATDVPTPLSDVSLIDQFAGFSHPFLTQSAADCPTG